MPNVKEIIALMHNPSKEDVAFVGKAYDFSEKAHEGHKRNSGEPFFNHVFETAKGLAGLGMGPRTIAAGFLHDSIEDVGVTRETIEKEFDKEVLFLVDGVTKLGALKYRGEGRHVESLRRLLVATSQDLRVLIIKLMDRLHNMKTLQFVPKEKQHRIALETLEIYAPIADRLGMGQLKRELEDLAFPYVNRQVHEKVKTLVAEETKKAEENLKKVHEALKKALITQGLKNFQTEHRIKGLYSLYQKLERKGNDLSKIYDIAALRILVEDLDDCYQALGVIHSLWRPLPGKIKDYIAFPKPNGYRSIHTTVFTGDTGIVEVQIRTQEMHREAQFGVASHLSYKEEGGKTRREQLQSNILWIRQLIPSLLRLPYPFRKKVVEPALDAPKVEEKEMPSIIAHEELGKAGSIPRWIKEIAEAHEVSEKEFLNTLRTDFFSYRVFVFTPKGDVIDLPIDSSPIDFAYAIHSDIGDHLTGVKVNSKMVPIDTKLKNGDIVEVITKQGSHPSQKWLDIAKTSLARKHIRTALGEKPSIR